ncbi:MAG: CopG family transcriptional regulator [Gammaproteobacteria bacterium]
MKTSYDFSAGKRGPVIPSRDGRTEITLLLDDEVIDWFRQQVNEVGGGDYRELINAVLCEHIESTTESREETKHRLIHEGLQAAG